MRILIWERGVGPTHASGTGACASAVAAAIAGGAGRDVDVHAPGGTQRVEWRDDGRVSHGLGRSALRGAVDTGLNHRQRQKSSVEARRAHLLSYRSCTSQPSLTTRPVANIHLRVSRLLAFATPTAEVATTANRQWVTDAAVNAATSVGDIAYLGGGFNYLGLVTNDGPSFVDQASAALVAGCATRTGTQSGVRPAVVTDSGGGLFMQVPLTGDRLIDAGGDFVAPSGESFVRVGDDCRFVRSFHLQAFVPGDSVTRGLTIARAGDVIYVGGTRSLGFGDQYGRVAAFNGSSGARVNAWDYDQFSVVLIDGVTPAGQLVVTTTARLGDATTQEVGILQPATGFFVRLAVIENVGSFVRVIGNTLFVLPAANRPLQAFDLTTAQARQGWTNPVLSVSDLEVGGGRVFVAGEGLGRRGVFALSEASGALVESFAPALGAAGATALGVERLALVDSRLFVRGRTVRTLETSSRYLLAAVNATTGAADPWAPLVFAPTAASIDLLPLGTRLFVGRVLAPALERRQHLAAVNTLTGALLPFDPNVAGGASIVPPVTALAASESHLFAGTSQGQIRRVALATGVIDSWSVTASAAAGAAGAVSALLLEGDMLYAGGHFTSVVTSSQSTPAARGHGLAVDPATAALLPWDPSVTSGATDPAQARRPITSLTRTGEYIIVGGNFSAVGGQPRVALAAVDLFSGAPALPEFTLAEGEIVLDTDQDDTETFFVGVGADEAPLIGVADTATSSATRWTVGSAGAPSSAIAWLGGVVYSGVEWDVEAGEPRPSSPAWVRPVTAASGLLELEEQTDGADSPVLARFHTATDGNVLTAPRDLAVLYSENEVYLSWRPPARGTAESFIVRAGPAAGESTFANIDTGSTQTSFRARAPEGVYFVRVHARRTDGISGPSNEVSFALVPFGCNAAPRAPAGLAGTSDADGASLEWGEAIGASAYLIEAGSHSGAADIATLDVGKRLSFDTAAPPGRYYVRARGVNSCGRGAASNEVVLTVGEPPPDPPATLTVQVTGRTATMSWPAPGTGALADLLSARGGHRARTVQRGYRADRRSVVCRDRCGSRQLLRAGPSGKRVRPQRAHR